jgi:hypothetical protein
MYVCMYVCCIDLFVVVVLLVVCVRVYVLCQDASLTVDMSLWSNEHRVLFSRPGAAQPGMDPGVHYIFGGCVCHECDRARAHVCVCVRVCVCVFLRLLFIIIVNVFQTLLLVVWGPKITF